MKLKKSLSMLAVVSLASSLLISACSKDNSEGQTQTSASPKASSQATASPADSTSGSRKVKPVDFSLFVNYDWYTAPKWGDPPQTKWITENLKVNINPIQSNGAAAQKLNSMVVSKELPDVIVLDRGKDVDRLQKAGMLVPLDDYLAKYPEFVKTVGEKNINLLRSSDGKLYQIPNWFISGDKGNGNAAYIVEKKIYKSLGSPKLETFADLENYLKLVKEKYPDVVPFDAGEIRDGAELQMLGMLYSGFGENKTTSFISPGAGQVFGTPSGNELKSVYEDPTFQEASLYISRLFREGLTSKDMFTATRDQIKEKLNNGKIAVFAAYDAAVEGIGREADNKLKAKDPEDGYQAIWPLHKDGVDKNKVFPSSYYTLGWNVNVITKNAKDPEAIFSYYNWLAGIEGQQIVFFGPPGMFYDKVEDGVPIPNDAYINRDAKKYDELKVGEYMWAGNTSYIDGTKAKREKLLPQASQDWTTNVQATIAFKTSMNTTEFANLDPDPSSEEGIVMQRLKDYHKQIVPKIVFAKSDDEVNALIKQAGQESMKLGYDKVLKFKTNIWQENRKKAGQ